MKDAEAALARILSNCKTRDDLQQHIMSHVIILQLLVCYMAKDVKQSEDGIRSLYSAWADMAVDQFSTSATPPPYTVH
jgi:hypothetical protein